MLLELLGEPEMCGSYVPAAHMSHSLDRMFLLRVMGYLARITLTENTLSTPTPAAMIRKKHFASPGWIVNQ